jgi:hypothetical protein
VAHLAHVVLGILLLPDGGQGKGEMSAGVIGLDEEWQEREEIITTGRK